MLHVSLLGEQAITDDASGLVLTRSPRSVALVGLLVARAGVPQPRQRIAALFWPDSTDAQALTNLRRELHHLRHAIGGEPALVVTSKDLCWRDTTTSSVDLRVFDLEREAALQAEEGEAVTHANAALAQYRGELLPGLHDDWVFEARSELEDHVVELCDLICEARGGDLAPAVAAARRRIQLRPLEETGYRTLMELQADLGDRAGAVGTYHRCASILERELGVVPDRRTREALERLLAHPPADTPGPGRAGLAAAELVGRSRELGLLQNTWLTAAAGRAGLALIRGDAGVGKTRLVTEIAGLARRQGAVVASSQCFGTSGRLALAPVADWLRTPPLQAAAAALDPVWRAEVDRLVPAGPAGGRGTVNSTGARAMVDAWQRVRFFEGLARALTAGGRPTLLVLDNLQWCDQETLAFLTFCLGLDAEAPLLVAATLRETLDEEPGVAEWIVRMRASGTVTELGLNPLDATGTARLAEALSGRALTEHDRNLLHATTGGFPLYVVEAMRTTGSLPAGDLRSVLHDRLAQPGPAAREIAGLAAAAGRDFSLDLLTEASDLDAGTVVRAVDELWRRRIIREFRDGYDFSHDLLREAAYQQISPPARWLLHRRLAQGLELLHADSAEHPNNIDAVSAQLAGQYARGGRPDRAVAYYRRAAEVAAGTFAHTEAIRLLKEALAIVRAQPAGRDSARQELAVLEAIAAPLNAQYGYASPELVQTTERAIVLAEALGHKDSTLTWLVGLFSSRFVQGKTAHSHEAAIRALSLVGPASTPDERGSAHLAVAGSVLSLGRPAEALRHFALAGELTHDARVWPIGTRPDVHGRAWMAHAQWLHGDAGAALSSSHEAVRLARTLGHPYSLAVALAYAGITHQMRRDQAELRAAVSELHELCGRYDFAYYREWALILGGWARGDATGVDLARRGIENLKAEGAFARMPYWLSLLADVSARNDRAADALATLDAAIVGARMRDDLWWLPEVTRMRAAYDDPQAALARLRSAALLAHAQESPPLLERCEQDLAALGVRFVPPRR